jgi:3-oxoisoapionate decarboxylase
MEKHLSSEQRTVGRRQFLGCAAAVVGTTALHGGAVAATPANDPTHASPQEHRNAWRLGTIAYSFQYAAGLLSYSTRTGEKWDCVKMLEATHATGGSVVQFVDTMTKTLDESGVKALRRRADELNMRIELHGNGIIQPAFEAAMQNAPALGAKVVVGNCGMLLRPDKIPTLAAWDDHLQRCEARLAELAPLAKRLGIVIGVENHLDFTTEELYALIKKLDSPQVGVLFDTGNSFGTLDDPIEAAEILGPYVVATHYKDFAVEEVTRGFRFTMVPLGCGSMRLGELTQTLLKRLRPDVSLCVEMLNGQQFEVCWLQDRFWVPYRGKSGRQMAAVLRHIRSKAIDIAAFKPADELTKMPHQEHVEFEKARLAQCISHLKGLIDLNDATSKP